MNKARRQELQKVANAITAAQKLLELIQADEEDYRDNMPENLQGSERYEKAEAAVDAMESAAASLEEALGYIEEAQE